MIARQLAQRDGAAVDVVNVLSRWGTPPPVHEYVDAVWELVTDRLARLVRQAETAFGDFEDWSVGIVDATDTSALATVAAEDGHDLVVVGLRRRLRDRLRRPTALRVAQCAPVPVLAVPRSVTTLPTRALIGVDGGEAALSAIRATARLLDATAVVHLVRVRNGGDSHDGGWSQLLERFARELQGSGRISIEGCELWGGEPAARLMEYAERMRADLIAVGSHGPGSMDQQRHHGVAWRMLRAARCCVLLSGGGGLRAA